MEENRRRGRGDFFRDYYPGTQRLMQGDQHGRAGQDIANRRWTLAGMENPNPLPTPGIIPGAYSIPGVDGDQVWNTLNPPSGELLITAGFLGDYKMFCHLWSLDLNNKKEIIFDSLEPSSAEFCPIAVSNKRAEVWIGDMYDRIYCINLLTKKVKYSIDINPYGSYGLLSYSMDIDDENEHLYVGGEDVSNGWVFTIFQIDLKERKVINKSVADFSHYQGIVSVGQVTVDDQIKSYLFVGGCEPTYNSLIKKYELPDLTYLSDITIPLYAARSNCVVANNKDGFIYVPTEDQYLAGGIPWYLVRINVQTDGKQMLESPEYYYRVGDVNESDGNVYYFGQSGIIPVPHEIYMFKFNKDMSLLKKSSAILPSDWFAGAGLQKNGAYIFGVTYGTGRSNIYKFRTSDLSLTKDIFGGRYYSAAGMYYK